MGFTEVSFLFVFLPFSILIYLFTDRVIRKDAARNSVLTALSLLFYGWADSRSLIIFLILVFFTYMAGYMVAAGNLKKLTLPMICLMGYLVFCKYVSFITVWINQLLDRDLISVGNLIVPLGLSFMVFEAVSYLTDIYRGDAEAGTLLECFTFMSLFPKLISGPIVLWKDFKPQLKKRYTSGECLASGIDRIIMGYAKKAILADTLGTQIALINTGISAGGVDTSTMWLKALLYFFQIYFDFSGYSDIAIGLCGIFGFSIKENFRFPYLSQSISEFWRRWHISLGTWFREYIYIPLGGNKKGNVYLHILTVFLLTGIWHGTGWNFLIWGAFHGILMILERAVREKNWYKRIPGIIKWLGTTVMVFFSWILFMSGTLSDAGKTYAGLFFSVTDGLANFTWQYYLSGRIKLVLILSMLGYLLGVQSVRSKFLPFMETIWGMRIKRILLLLLLIADVLFTVNSGYSPFIYFQF